MNGSPLLRDIRQLGQWKAHKKTNEQLEHHQRDILQRITTLGISHEIWAPLITQKGGC